MTLSGLPEGLLPVFRVDVNTKLKNQSRIILSQLPSIGVLKNLDLTIAVIYFLEGRLLPNDLQKIAASLLSDPVTDHYQWKSIENDGVGSFILNGVIEVAYVPGVTDNVANELLSAAHRLGITRLQSVATGIHYEFTGDLTEAELDHIARSLLVNTTIQRYTLGEITPEFFHPPSEICSPQQINLVSFKDDALSVLSTERRLSLNLNEMHAIQAYFVEKNRPATDAELETIAQTWSEHCVHKTFKAIIEIRDLRIGDQAPKIEIGDDFRSSMLNSIIKTFLQSATTQINAPWVRSAFVDNAGVIEFDEEYDLSFKVETHNHPSAIEPFGGANTGVGGVVRDILGVSHRPIAVTDVLCFGPVGPGRESGWKYQGLPEGVLHPARVRAGVVAGIEDYGNKLGLPTVNGAVIYHPGYTANPLVYCGCVGLGPRGSHPRGPQPGDRVIVMGGRTGRDGLRGATFSSLTMDAQTGQVAGASVQIGDPIAEKGIIEVIERARDAGLYNAITDCGAGGLSSAVGEMGEHVGAFVDLAKVPLKYAGLEPWEIWLSEAQERMVLAVPSEKLSALKEICDTYWVEMSNIGYFGVEGGKLLVVHGEIPIVDLDMSFLHACPRLELEAEIPPSLHPPFNQSQVSNLPSSITNNQLLITLLSHPNIASKESIIRVYDHEVRGMSIVKPLVGVCADAPSDAAVMKPLETKGWKGFVLANGINPLIGEVDPYAMAVSAVDEAIRNAVAVGADPDRIAILDNFCWGNPRRPETLGSLVAAAQGCYSAALHYGTPFISGKDSLNNEYLGSDGQRHAIPGTLLISAIGIHPDVRNAVTMDLKEAENYLYLVGDFQPFLAGSHAFNLAGHGFFNIQNLLQRSAQVSNLTLQVYRALHSAIHHNLVRSAHDLSEGGLAVAAAEMCIGGRLGLKLDLTPVDENPAVALFAETNGCLLVEVPSENAHTFEQDFAGLPYREIGRVTADTRLTISHAGAKVLEIETAECVRAFSGSIV